MPWLIGIDEAGYGPNLGPLVMSAVACRLPAGRLEDDLWQVLGSAVRRKHEDDDGRLLVDDSKLVYASERGLAALERAVFALLAAGKAAGKGVRNLLPERPEGCCAQKVPDPFSGGGQDGSDQPTLARLIDQVGAKHHEELRREHWYQGDTQLPLQARDWPASQEVLERVCRQNCCQWGAVRVVLVCPPRFNGLLDRHGSKAAILALGLAELLRYFLDLDGGEAQHFVIDKHGGRHYYSSMLQQACAAGLVAVAEEGADRSVYQVLGLSRPVQVTFQPRADSEHLCVALASMVSKYLRELLMLEFNRFWQRHVPGLKATAGYPGDAARFLSDIRPALAVLGLSESELWRRK